MSKVVTNNLTSNYHGQVGQSLIETIIAIFILTTALTASLGVVIYSFSSSTASQHEIIAANLAREGAEVVRMMRDSNWLASDAKGDAWDLQGCSDIGGRLCFPQSRTAVTGYNAYNLGDGNYRLSFDPVTSVWTLDPTVGYDMYLQPSGIYSHTATGQSQFARQIVISSNSSAPYTNENSNQEMIIQSVVAWRGPSCTSFGGGDNLIALSTPCKIIVEEHLTNWKDYK